MNHRYWVCISAIAKLLNTSATNIYHIGMRIGCPSKVNGAVYFSRRAVRKIRAQLEANERFREARRNARTAPNLTTY